MSGNGKEEAGENGEGRREWSEAGGRRQEGGGMTERSGEKEQGAGVRRSPFDRCDCLRVPVEVGDRLSILKATKIPNPEVAKE